MHAFCESRDRQHAETTTDFSKFRGTRLQASKLVLNPQLQTSGPEARCPKVPKLKARCSLSVPHEALNLRPSCASVWPNDHTRSAPSFQKLDLRLHSIESLYAILHACPRRKHGIVCSLKLRLKYVFTDLPANATVEELNLSTHIATLLGFQ